MNLHSDDRCAGPKNVRVAAIQMISTTRVEENLNTAAALIAEAVADGAELVALPEYFPIMGRRDGDKIAAREVDGSGPIQDFLAETASKHGIWVIGGSMPLVASVEDKVLNTCLAFNPQGVRVARYDKIHLFGFQKGEERYNESATIEPGRQPVTFDAPFGRVGLSICYDLRFPELFRALGEIDLLVLPAAFTEVTGRAHWEILLRARAIENLAYVLAPAQGGDHENGRRTWGQSMVINPWGKVLNQLAEGEGVVVADCDWALMQEMRQQLPALQHRKFR